MKSTRRLRILHSATLITLLLAVATPAAADPAHNRCVTADVPGNVTLPDGSSHPAGSIKICLRQKWTPVIGLHEIRIDGHSVGLFMSRIDETEEYGKSGPLILFLADGPGAYKLVGYAWPNGRTAKTYRLGTFRRQKTSEQLTARKEIEPKPTPADAEPLGEGGEEPEQEAIVLLAARVTP